MPIYHYKCDCGYDQEIYHSIHESIRTLCPYCSENTLIVVIDTIPYGTVKEIKTIGQLAEHNAKKMGKEMVQKKMESDGVNERIKQEEAMKEVRKLATLSPEKKEKYIVEGKL